MLCGDKQVGQRLSQHFKQRFEWMKEKEQLIAMIDELQDKVAALEKKEEEHANQTGD